MGYGLRNGEARGTEKEKRESFGRAVRSKAGRGMMAARVRSTKA